MIGAFLAGAVAGYGVAIPVGPIAILILDTALRRGLRIRPGRRGRRRDGRRRLRHDRRDRRGGHRRRHRAGVGAAALGVGGRPRGHRRAAGCRGPAGDAGRRRSAAGASVGNATDPEAAARHRAIATYLRFLGLTIVNPSTVVYFAALVVGLPAVSGGAAERLVFAAGAFIASISWQSLLAVVGAVVHRRLPPSARLYTSLAGNLIVLLLAANIVRGLVP